MPGRLVLGWALSSLGAVLALLCTVVAALRPAPLRVDPGTPGEPLMRIEAAEQRPVPLALPGSHLRLVVSRQAVRVLAPGGGGAGALPLVAGPVERVRVFGVDRGFRIAVGQGGALRITDIDRDGVRLDDDLGRRVLDRTGRLGMAVVLGAVVACLLGALRFSADAALALRALGVIAPMVVAALLVGLRAAFG